MEKTASRPSSYALGMSRRRKNPHFKCSKCKEQRTGQPARSGKGPNGGFYRICRECVSVYHRNLVMDDEALSAAMRD